MQDLMSLLIESPHYVFGRFRMVREAYGVAQGLRQRLTTTPTKLRLGEKFGDPLHEITPAKSPFVESVLPNKAHVNNLREYAFSPGLRLTSDAVTRLQQAARTMPLFHAEEPLPSLEVLESSEELLKKYAIANVKGCSDLEVIQSIGADRDVLAVVAGYLGYFPRQAGAWLFWSLRNDMNIAERESAHQTVRFHYDVHGYNFLYVNFYLLDTDERTGAHVLIESSHHDKKARHLFGSARLDDAQAAYDYGSERIRMIRGPAGTGFFEDTACYHKALAPIDRARLMLQFRFQ